MTMKVRITEGYAVYVESLGKQTSGPDELEVEDATARHWISRGWATPAKAKDSPPSAKKAAPPRR